MVERDWLHVSRRAPCPACGKPDWCKLAGDGSAAFCRRSSEGPQGPGRERHDKHGEPFWVHPLNGEPVLEWTPAPGLNGPVLEAARPDTLARVYAGLLDRLRLAPRNREDLLARGFTEEEIARAGYRTLPLRGRKRLAESLEKEQGPEACSGTPGLFQKTEEGNTWWTLAGSPGLLVPLRDRMGRVLALQIRRDEVAEDEDRYLWLSSTKHGGPGPAGGVHAPLFDWNGGAVRLTEGPLKADLATFRTGTLTLAVAGVGRWREALPLLRDLAPARVLVAFDADWRTKPHVARALLAACEGLAAEGFTVAVETWPEEAGKGIDDLLQAGDTPEALVGERLQEVLRDAAQRAATPSANGREDRNGPAPRANVIPIRAPGRQEDALPTAGALALDEDQDEGEGRKLTQAERLLSLAASATLFRTPGGEAHVTLQARGRQETWPIRGKLFSSWLRHEHMTAEGRPVGADPVRQAVDTLEARALHGREALVREIFVRSAGAGGRIWIDLADDEGRAISIGPEGWAVTRTPPVAFRRTPDMLALPVPSREGSWEELRPLLNLDEEGWILFVGFLVGALAPLLGYPLLMVEGVQGAAKSSLARAARLLLDPAGLDVQRPPEQERDLFIRASNTRLLALDNLTRPPRWLSDSLCTLATGGGYACRELHTDREEAYFRACLPIILTGIEGLAQGDDLADRSIVLTLAAIPPEARLQEQECRSRLLAARPRILGALCDALSGALAFRGKVSAPGGLPRMADFAAFVLAAEEAGTLPWEPGRFAAALLANRGAAAVLGLERDLLASTIADLVEEAKTWTGTATALLAALETRLPEGSRRPKSWPGGPHILTQRLPRIEPLLREAGILVTKGRATDRGRGKFLTLRHVEDGAPPAPKLFAAEVAETWEEGAIL